MSLPISRKSCLSLIVICYRDQQWISRVFSNAIITLLNDARFRDEHILDLRLREPRLYGEDYKGLNDITRGGSSGSSDVDPQSGQNVTGAGLSLYNERLSVRPL